MITMVSIANAYSRLSAMHQGAIGECDVELCIYEETEFRLFTDALSTVLTTAASPAPPPQPACQDSPATDAGLAITLDDTNRTDQQLRLFFQTQTTTTHTTTESTERSHPDTAQMQIDSQPLPAHATDSASSTDGPTYKRIGADPPTRDQAAGKKHKTDVAPTGFTQAQVAPAPPHLSDPRTTSEDVSPTPARKREAISDPAKNELEEKPTDTEMTQQAEDQRPLLSDQAPAVAQQDNSSVSALVTSAHTRQALSLNHLAPICLGSTPDPLARFLPRILTCLFILLTRQASMHLNIECTHTTNSKCSHTHYWFFLLAEHERPSMERSRDNKLHTFIEERNHD